jgi:hypothetical protein
MRFELKLFLGALLIFGPLDVAAWIITLTIEPEAITPAVAILIILYIVGMTCLVTRLFGGKDD